MTELEQRLLQEHLDGSLPEERQGELVSLLDGNADARRYVAEHQLLWEALGEAFPEAEDVQASQEFRESVSDAVGRPALKRVRLAWVASVAAAALLAVGVSSWMHRQGSPLEGITGNDREVVRYLHVLRDLDFMQAYGAELDLRGDLEVFHAFAGEMEGEG